VTVEASAKDGRKIKEYRWFVDNRLVACSKIPAFLWDTSGLENGFHFLTVHAIDTKWNRAASQIPVIVKRD